MQVHMKPVFNPSSTRLRFRRTALVENPSPELLYSTMVVAGNSCLLVSTNSATLRLADFISIRYLQGVHFESTFCTELALP